jgi:hypothetical protein
VTPEQRQYLTATRHEPGQAAYSSCRHAWGTIRTAHARLDVPPPTWTPEQVAEARSMLDAAAELVRAV